MIRQHSQTQAVSPAGLCGPTGEAGGMRVMATQTSLADHAVEQVALG